MKTFFKKLPPVFLALIMILGLIPAVFADDPEPVSVATEETLFAELAKIEPVSIKLTADIKLTQDTSSDESPNMIKSGSTVILDLNGHTITTDAADVSYIRNAGTLTVKDSAGGGRISATTSNGYVQQDDGSVISEVDTSKEKTGFSFKLGLCVFIAAIITAVVVAVLLISTIKKQAAAGVKK